MAALPGKIRAFIALRLAAEVEYEIDAFVTALRRADGGISWVARGQLHVTLRFLGAAVDSNLIPPLDHALAEIAAAAAPFALDVRATGAFPNLDRPRVLWLGLAGDELIPLARAVETAAVRCGFAPETRPYSAHLTIARVRDPRGWRLVKREFIAAAGRDFGVTRVDSLTLYRSILGNGPATYHELGRYSLKPRV